MGVEGNTGICRLLQTLGATSRGDPLNRSFWRLHHWSSFLKEGSSAAIASTEGVVAASFFGFSLSLQRKQKAETSHKSKEREQVKDKISSQQKLMSLRGRKAPHPLESRRPPDSSLRSGGTQRHKLLDTFPLPIETRVF
jgi:hypothetical protein